ncbi:MAG TPA: formylglycine-generating enzyme family protein [Burkholderiales bacterium]|nr:formylglycine-generating enzyme family protein [Burkholderiales bacterium]
MTHQRYRGACGTGRAAICAIELTALLWLAIGPTHACAETQSVIDPVEAFEPSTPPAPAVRKPSPDVNIQRERRRAQEEQRKRVEAEARAAAAESEAAKLRETEQARQASAAAREAAARAAARKTAAARAAKARIAAEREAARKAAEKEAAARQAAARVAAAKKAARIAAAKDAAAREAAAKEAAAREAAAREIAAREAAAREAAAKEAAAREAAAREAAAREAAAREAAAREAAAKEAAAREAAAREAAAREAAAKEAAAREAAAREAAAREVAAKEAAAREAAAREARASMNPLRVPSIFRDCPDCPEVVWLPRGEWVVDQPSAASVPRYVVKIGYMLAVSRFKVTFSEWYACVAARGCRRRPEDVGWTRGRQPVTSISWADAQEYVAWLSRRTSKNYRLLTADEWEYAARAASELLDMRGSVSEWVDNCYQYRVPRSDGRMWKLECTNQLVRGGASPGPAGAMRAVVRPFAPFDYDYYDDRIGFRIARTE